MKVVGFLNNKGGVGKTGSITTLAHMIATEYKRKVLVVDLSLIHISEGDKIVP